MTRPTLEWAHEPEVVQLPPPPGLVAVATGVTVNGAILRLFATKPPPPRPQGRTHRQHEADLRARALVPDHAVLQIADGTGRREVPLAGPIPRFPYVDQLPTGDILVVGARCRFSGASGPERNARLHDPHGALLRELTLGDGIAKVQVDHAGAIWVSYFDEGIFGNLGWGDGGAASQPLGFAGLARFDDRGNKVWDYEPPPGLDEMADCYALNVGSSGAWAYYYTDFPLVHLSTSGKVRAWRTDVKGGRAIVTDGWRAIVFGGYGEERTACVALRLEDGERARVVADVTLRLPDGASLASAHVIGCGDTLHVFDGERAHRFRLGALPPA